MTVTSGIAVLTLFVAPNGQAAAGVVGTVGTVSGIILTQYPRR